LNDIDRLHPQKALIKTMKKNKLSIFAAAVGTAWLAASMGVLAQPIGVNFVNTGDGGVQDANADSLNVDELAGAPGYAQTNWNNFGRWGSVTSVSNSVGITIPVTINWDAAGNGSSGSAAALGTPDGKLMDGLLDPDWNNGLQTPITAQQCLRRWR
jgi:hypothetical protein